MGLKNFKKFSVYEPDETDSNMLGGSYGVVFLRSEDNFDWYDCQKLFSPDTTKICYDDNNVIRSIARGCDASTLWPLGFSVAEVESKSFLEQVDISGGWIYIDGQVKRREHTDDELIRLADINKNTLLKSTLFFISPLQDAVDLGIATDEEKVKLDEWKKYRVLLNRIDTSLAPNITWPSKPAE